MLHNLLITPPGSRVRFRVLQILLSEFRERDFDRLAILTALNLRNPQSVELFRLTPVGSSGAFLNPLAMIGSFPLASIQVAAVNIALKVGSVAQQAVVTSQTQLVEPSHATPDFH